jgi:hypothetical protein
MGTKVIPREARKITYSAEIRNLKKRLSLSDYQRDLIIGSLLGDGCLKTNYRLKVQHSVKQSEYVYWKAEILGEWLRTPPRYQKVNRSIRFRTISHEKLTALRHRFYRNSRKTIPTEVKNLLSPFVIAVWFMDDGNIIRHEKRTVRGFHLNTQSFNQRENVVLKDCLHKVYGLSVGLETNHGKTRIYINTSSVNRFRDIVRPHIVSGMQYKLG